MTNILQLAIRVSSVVSLSTLSKLIKWTLIEWLIEWLCVSETRNSPNCHGSGSAVGVGEESAELWRRRSLQSVCISARLRSTSRPREGRYSWYPSSVHMKCLIEIFNDAVLIHFRPLFKSRKTVSRPQTKSGVQRPNNWPTEQYQMLETIFQNLNKFIIRKVQMLII